MPTLNSSEKERALREVMTELAQEQRGAQEKFKDIARRIVVKGLLVAALFVMCGWLGNFSIGPMRIEVGPIAQVAVFVLGSALILGGHLLFRKG